MKSATMETPAAPLPVQQPQQPEVKLKTPEKPAQKAAELQHVPTELIVPSPTNPRQIRDAEKDKELFESIAVTGVLQPVLLRTQKATAWHAKQWDGTFKSIALPQSAVFGVGDMVYEIVAGQRRWEGSMKAGKLTIPAMIREMTNEEVGEAQIIENLQRAGVDPMDEAEAFVRWRKLDANKYTAEYMAERVGKSTRYVWQCIQRENLIPELKELFRKGEISSSHADLLCRLVSEQQKTALKAKNALFDWNDELSTIRHLKQWIQQYLQLSLDGAPWDKNDARLVPAAGACSSCQKNTAVNPNLDEEAKRATCTDRACYEQKQKAHLVQIEDAVKKSGEKVLRVGGDYNSVPTKNNEFVRHGQWTEVKAKACDSATAAVIVNGDRAGSRVTVCANKSCKVHNESGPACSRPKPAKKSPAELKKEEEVKKKEQLQAHVNLEVMTALSNSKNMSMDRWMLNSFASLLLQTNEWNFDEEWVKQFLATLGFPKCHSIYEIDKAAKSLIPKLPEHRLVSLIVVIMASGFHYDLPIAPKDFAAHYKVDMKKIEKQVKDRAAAAAKQPQQATLTTAKKAAGKSKR